MGRKPVEVEEEEVEEEEEEDDEEEEDEADELDEVDPDKTKFQLMHDFIKTTTDFLLQYNDMTENRTKYRTLYLKHLNPLRETLAKLLCRLMQQMLPREDHLHVHIKCCGDELLNNEDFGKHYKKMHKKDDSALSLPEAKIIEAFCKTCRTYMKHGIVVNEELLYKLRRVLRKTNMILMGLT